MAIAAPQPRVLADVVAQTWVRNLVLVAGGAAFVGLAGVPWFAEGSSGFSAPSFGYILGFILAAFIVGRIAEDGATRSVARTAGLMVVGNLVVYAVSVTWLKGSMDLAWCGRAGVSGRDHDFVQSSTRLSR